MLKGFGFKGWGFRVQGSGVWGSRAGAGMSRPTTDKRQHWRSPFRVLSFEVRVVTT